MVNRKTLYAMRDAGVIEPVTRGSKTSHRMRFVLNPQGRPDASRVERAAGASTKDLDFLGRLDNSLENLERVVREVYVAEVEPDGMVFDPLMVKAERIKEDAHRRAWIACR